MSILKSLILAAVLTCVAVPGLEAAAVNQVFDVHNVTELTNALTEATANFNVIRVFPGTYDLHGIEMATETIIKEQHGIHLKMYSYGGKLLGMGATPSETVIKGGGAVDQRRILTFAKTQVPVVVSNLTFTSGYVATTSGAGGVCVAKNIKFIDCRFVDNYAGNFAGAIDQPNLTIERCYFENNESASAGGVYRGANGIGTFEGCTFVGNRSTKGGVGFGSAVFRACSFVGNFALNGGVVSHNAGAATDTAFVDCVFTNNYASDSYAIFDAAGSGVTNCTFVGNFSGVWGTHTGDYVLGNCSSIVDCRFFCNTGMPMLTACTLRSCMLAGNVGHRKNVNPLFANSSFYNCLVTRNRGGFSNQAPIFTGSSLYNCTVVSNKYQGTTYMSLQSGGVAVNTIFAGNYLYAADDWSSEETYVGRRDVNGQYAPLMTNCLWTAANGTVSTAVGGGIVTDAGLKFADAANGDYTIKRSSVARNAGWGDAAYLAAIGETDLDGNPRVYAGDGPEKAIIDVGCYECVLKPLGLVMLLK